MTLLKRLFTLSAMLALAACGGGGGSSGSSPFNPGGPGTPGTAVASDILLTLSAPTVANSGTDTVRATVTAVDANRNTVAGIPVTISVDEGATVQVSGTATAENGTVSGTIGVGENRSNRTITVRATSGALVREVALRVVGTRITATAVPGVIAPGTAGQVLYSVVDAAGNPQINLPVSVTGPGGAATTGSTGASGNYEFNYNAPATAGTLDIRISAGGVEATTTVVVQGATTTVPTVPLNTVRSATVRANPSVVAVNPAGTGNNRTEVRALFVGDNNAPIRNVRVRFDLAGDVNSIGGSFSTGNVLVYSDANGVALSAYVPGSRFSPTDGVTVRACWDYADFPAGTCPNATTTTVTVISDPLSVSIGTDELIVTGDLTYTKRFVVQVNDSSGLARPDVLISPLLDLLAYSKGFYVRQGSRWVQNVTAAGCENEDINRNGILEVYSNGQAEDANRNGSLDPRKADVVVAFDGPQRTDATGQVRLRITYPRNVGSWLRFNLTVAAAGVAGTEGRASFVDVLPVPADALTNETPPAFVLSPYGVEASPVTVVTTPDGSARATLCSNPN